MSIDPVTEFDPRYSEPDGEAVPWSETRQALERAELYWISTVRPEGRPHVTPLVGVWHDGAMFFTTGEGERKQMNLSQNPKVALTTGSNEWASGFDIVVEGTAVRVEDGTRLQEVADVYRAKYGDAWSFEVSGSKFVNRGVESLVFEVEPSTGFGFGKGPFSQTRYRFDI